MSRDGIIDDVSERTVEGISDVAETLNQNSRLGSQLNFASRFAVAPSLCVRVFSVYGGRTAIGGFLFMLLASVRGRVALLSMLAAAGQSSHLQECEGIGLRPLRSGWQAVVARRCLLAGTGLCGSPRRSSHQGKSVGVRLRVPLSCGTVGSRDG